MSVWCVVVPIKIDLLTFAGWPHCAGLQAATLARDTCHVTPRHAVNDESVKLYNHGEGPY